jgi:hypothetical protein
MEEHEISGFGQRPGPRPGTALVAYREDCGLVLMGSPEAAGMWGWLRRPRLVYRVDLRPHDLEYAMQIPCDGDALHFIARVHVSCRVRDPKVIVERGIKDAHRAVGYHVAGALGPVGRTYSIRQARRAHEHCTNLLLALVGRPIANGGLELESAGVGLQVDEAAHARIRGRELMVLDGETQTLATTQELERLKAYFDHYFNIMPERDRHLIASVVASDPKALPTVLAMVREDRKVARDESFGWLRELMGRGKLDEYDLDPVTRALIAQLVGADARILGPIAPAPAAITGNVIDDADDEEPDEAANGSAPSHPDELEPPPSNRLRRRSREGPA